MEENSKQICPWCTSEIIWDEELGPEKHCPHCDNELGNYRSLTLDEAVEEEEVIETEQLLDEEDENALWEDDDQSFSISESEWGEEQEGFRQSNRKSLSMDSTVQKILDEQAEMPECPSCREYMLEAGQQQISKEQNFVPTISPVLQNSILGESFNIVWYVCPTCFHTSTQLVLSERLAVIQKLAVDH
ncbi:hypothetical protein ACFSTH_07200 [Paenibacillus yanchengensis]|uniref:Uncharacterized protein n=1 Tax=Paenibacillus yanchengensis TaxID=2035833 RepID=A0ABW4YM85_9BACL